MKELMERYGLTIKQISERFQIPYRTVQNWKLGTRECPEYVLKMMIEILEGDKEMKIQNIIDDAYDYIATTYAGLTDSDQENYDKYIDSYVNDYVESTYKEELATDEINDVIDAVVDLWREA